MTAIEFEACKRPIKWLFPPPQKLPNAPEYPLFSTLSKWRHSMLKTRTEMVNYEQYSIFGHICLCSCQQRGILLCMRLENFFGAFGAILIFSARFCGFSTERSTPFCDTFWRGMKEYDKFTTISNSVDTRGVCWLFGWGYFNDQSANKTRKKAENLKFEIWFADDQDVHMRLQTLKVSLKMLISYFYESRSGVWRRSWDIRYDNRR